MSCFGRATHYNKAVEHISNNSLINLTVTKTIIAKMLQYNHTMNFYNQKNTHERSYLVSSPIPMT